MSRDARKYREPTQHVSIKTCEGEIAWVRRDIVGFILRLSCALKSIDDAIAFG
jgi:hypothetical protein